MNFIIETKSIYDNRCKIIYIPNSKKNKLGETSGNFYYNETPFYYLAITQNLKLIRYWFREMKSHKNKQRDFTIKIINE